MTDVTPEQLVERSIKGELTPEAADAMLDMEGFCVQLLGIDGGERAVYYAADVGQVFRRKFNPETAELERTGNSFVGHDLETESEKVDPFSTAFLHLTANGEDWSWIHPRFRWLADELDELATKRHA